MEVALTGSTGFVGRRIVEKLLEAEHTVRCLVRPTSNTAAIERAGVSFVIGDLDDRESLEMLVEGADAVIHDAVWRDSSLLQIGSEQPMRHFETNLLGSVALLELARLHATRQFIFVSSGAVFGDPPGNAPLTEDHVRAPTTNYGAYKASVETFCQAYGAQFDYNACALRPFAVIGLHDPADQSPFFDLVKRVVNGERVEATRGQKYVLVDDVAAAVVFALGRGEMKGQIYNLCDGFVHQQDIAQMAREISNSGAEIVPSERKSPQHEAPSDKIKALGFAFGGKAALRGYVEQLVNAIRARR